MKSPKLDAALIEALRVKMADDGLGFERAIAELGVDRSTAHRWKRKGQQNIREDRELDGHKANWSRVHDECQSVMVAKAERMIYGALKSGGIVCSMCEKDALSEKDKLHNAHWVAARLAREDYGDKSEIQITSKMEEGFEALRPHMPAQSYRDMIVAFARLHGMDTGAAGGDGPDADNVESGD